MSSPQNQPPEQKRGVMSDGILRLNVIHALGLCTYKCDGKPHKPALDEDESADVDRVMKLYRDERNAMLDRIGDKTNDFYTMKAIAKERANYE